VNSINSLRFVSCGRPEIDGLAFEELFKIFDLKIWLWSFILLVAMPVFAEIKFTKVATHIPLKNRVKMYLVGFVNRLLSLIKALIEQGDSYFSESSLYITKGAFLIAAVVLTNAYKGENVFNLVANRKPVPYENFPQLVKDNFTIYAAVNNPLLDMDYCYLEVYKTISKSRYRPMALAVSEPSMLAYKMANNKSIHWKQITKEQGELLQMVDNRSQDLPTEKQTFKRVCEEVYPVSLNHTEKKRKSNEYSLGRSAEVTKSFNKWQKIHGLEVIKQCGKTAIVASDYFARSLAKLLAESRASSKDIYVGRDVLYERLLYVKLTGWVRQSVVKRISTVGASGIWEFWLKIFISKSTPNEADNEDLTKPTLSGNISVIFTLLLGGLAISICVFLLEILQILKRSLLYLKIRVHNKLSKSKASNRVTSVGCRISK